MIQLSCWDIHDALEPKPVGSPYAVRPPGNKQTLGAGWMSWNEAKTTTQDREGWVKM